MRGISTVSKQRRLSLKGKCIFLFITLFVGNDWKNLSAIIPKLGKIRLLLFAMHLYSVKCIYQVSFLWIPVMSRTKFTVWNWNKSIFFKKGKAELKCFALHIYPMRSIFQQRFCYVLDKKMGQTSMFICMYIIYI
jgi:hypothetical protein